MRSPLICGRAWTLTLMCVLLFTGVAVASPATYTSQAAFFGDLSGPPQILNFDSQGVGTIIPSGTALGGITFTYSLGPLSLQVRNDFGTTSPLNYLGVNTVDGTLLNGEFFTIDFPSPITGLGLYFIGAPGANLPGDFSLATIGSGGLANATPDRLLSDGDAYFLGVIDPAGFSQAIVIGASGSCTQPDCQYVWNVDDITYTVAAQAPVPEPSTLLLLGAGIGVVAMLRSRRWGDRWESNPQPLEPQSSALTN